MKKAGFFVIAGVLAVMAAGPALAAGAEIRITVSNKTGKPITPAQLRHIGTVAPKPMKLDPSRSQTYTNTSFGNVTSFHVDYSNDFGKECHFDAASFVQVSPIGGESCAYTQAAKPKQIGSHLATCKATISSSPSAGICSFAVQFEIQ